MAKESFVGRAGQLAVMAEFLLRGYNVAMPEVDVGDDIFVVHDRRGTLWRIQVKTALGKPRSYGYSGQFAVGLKQLRRMWKRLFRCHTRLPERRVLYVLRWHDRLRGHVRGSEQ